MQHGGPAAGAAHHIAAASDGPNLTSSQSIQVIAHAAGSAAKDRTAKESIR